MKALGFTLIELLAVIVILAIIALIATPIVLGIIDDTKESAQLRSAEMYLDGVENAVMRENINNNGNFKPTQCDITDKGNLYCSVEDVLLEVEVDGEKPKDGEITFEAGKIKEVSLKYETSTIVKNEEGKLVFSDEKSTPQITYKSLGNYQHQVSNGTIEYHDTESGTCSKCNQEVLAAGLYKEDGTFVSWEQLLADNILSQSSSGEFKSTYDVWSGDNLSVCDYLNGTLIVKQGLTKIGYYGLHGTDLKEIVLPDSVTELDSCAISACSKLETITFTNNLIPDEYSEAIYSCDNLRTINFIGTMKQWQESEWNDYRFGLCPDIIVNCLVSITNNKEEKQLKPGLYNENNELITTWDQLLSTDYKSYTYNDMLTFSEITTGILHFDNDGGIHSAWDGDYGVNHSADNLNGKLVLPDDQGITKIGWFMESKLTSIVIPNSVKTIYGGSFSNCENLTSITIPNSITSIEEYTFENITKALTINYLGTKTEWNNISFGEDWNFNCPKIIVHCIDGDFMILVNS